MSVKKKNTKKKLVSKELIHDNIYAIIPLLLIVGIIPLIVYIKHIALSDVEQMYAGGTERYDIFSYYKMFFLLSFSIMGLIAFLFKPGNDLLGKPRKVYYLALGIYTLFVILSALVSEYKVVAFRGFMDRFEGAYALIAYVVIMLLAMNVIKEEKHIKILFICLLTSTFVISVLGVLQLLGYDYFSWSFLSNLMIPPKLRGLGSIQTKMAPKTLFTTLVNPNYVGSYIAMLMPIVLIFLIWVKKIYYKLVLLVLLCLVVINWLGCGSRAGIVGGLLSLIILLIMFRKRIVKHNKIAISTVILVCGSLVIMNFVMKGFVVNEIKRITSIQQEIKANETRINQDKALKGLVDISMDNERMKIFTDKGTLQIVLSGDRMVLLDENNKQIDYTLKNENFYLTDTRFTNIRLLTVSKKGLIQVYFNDSYLIQMLVTKNGLRSDSNIWLNYRNDEKIESFGFKGMETFASGRGYIWSRTIPLLKHTILLGHGPDTFPIYFPQYDFVGKVLGFGEGSIFVDKAHNMYLQIALNTGVISLLALLMLFGIYAYTSIKIYIKEEFASFLPIAGLACFTAFCGYAAAGIFNDSVIAVAPVFWVLLGLGAGINIMLKEKKPVMAKKR